MAVYVDELLDHGPKGVGPQWPYRYSCHLVADTVEELHAFAQKLGMKREWFQMSRGGTPHYDLTKTRRAKAIKMGAKPLDSASFVKLIRRLRNVAN